MSSHPVKRASHDVTFDRSAQSGDSPPVVTFPHITPNNYINNGDPTMQAQPEMESGDRKSRSKFDELYRKAIEETNEALHHHHHNSRNGTQVRARDVDGLYTHAAVGNGVALSRESDSSLDERRAASGKSDSKSKALTTAQARHTTTTTRSDERKSGSKTGSGVLPVSVGGEAVYSMMDLRSVDELPTNDVSGAAKPVTTTTTIKTQVSASGGGGRSSRSAHYSEDTFERSGDDDSVIEEDIEDVSEF